MRKYLMIDIKESREQLWEKGWDGHEKAQLKRMASLPFREKIKWLEEAQEMLIQASKRNKKQKV